ncbi:MAG: cyclic nucleotide-binding domain-containing protein, partial [Saprospiraceae bacterium]|nr:cyclic nucleotide-binding domain-containing protein [Saprospiraceae bacterium]
MKDQALWFLENIDVTGIFCPKKLGSGAFHVDKRYRKGEYVYMPDDAADKIFFLFDGRIKIGAYGDSGKEITKAILGRGEVFGELAVLGEKTRRDFAQAMEDTTVCMISANEMKTLMQDHST